MSVETDRKYMIYLRGGRHLVCDESFGEYVKPDEVVRKGISGCLDAEIEAGYLQLKALGFIGRFL